MFAFHGKLNEEFDGLEAGRWARDITKAKDGRFTFVDKQTRIKIGDTIYFWTYVIYNGLGYREEDGEYVVKQYTNMNTNNRGPSGSGGSASDTCARSLTKVNGQYSCINQLIFSETFDTGAFDASKWNTEIRFSTEPDHEFVIYQNRKEQLYVKDGDAFIRPMLYEDIYGAGAVKNESKLDLGPA